MDTQKLQSWSDALKNNTPLLCGILNVTPDSFSDGGKYTDYISIKNHIDALISHGAKMIDVGAESTRPGSLEVSPADEIKRLNAFFDVIKNENFNDITFSIDTRHSETAQWAISNGIEIINDISAGTFDKDMPKVISENKVLFIAMHSRSTPDEMHLHSEYNDVVEEVIKELSEKISGLLDAGISPSKIMVDPGIGFAKTPEQNLELINSIDKIKSSLDFPLMVGVSRKSVIAHIIRLNGQSDDIELRDQITAELSVSMAQLGADVLRVHNVLKVNELLNTKK